LVLPESTSDSEDSEAEVNNELGGTGTSGQLTPLPSTSKSGSPEIKEPKEEPVDACIPPPLLDMSKLKRGLSSRLRQDSGSPLVPLSPSSPATSEGSGFRSVITTRSQKARAESIATTASHLATPPLSASGSSGPRTRSASLGRNAQAALAKAGNTTSASVPPATGSPVKRGRGRPRKYPRSDAASLPASASTSQPTTKANTPLVDSQRGSAAVEQRTLRLRKSILANGAFAKSASTPDLGTESESSKAKAKEPAGPVCMTCSLPLPVPVDESISAGVKRKRKLAEEKEDCLRYVNTCVSFNDGC
jgi:hypothetical protein